MRIQSLWKRHIKFYFKAGLIVRIYNKFKLLIRHRKILGTKNNIINNYRLKNFKKVLINYKFNSKLLKKRNKNNFLSKINCKFNRNFLQILNKSLIKQRNRKPFKKWDRRLLKKRGKRHLFLKRNKIFNYQSLNFKKTLINKLLWQQARNTHLI